MREVHLGRLEGKGFLLGIIMLYLVVGMGRGVYFIWGALGFGQLLALIGVIYNYYYKAKDDIFSLLN